MTEVTHVDQVGFIPGKQGWFSVHKSLHIAHHASCSERSQFSIPGSFSSSFLSYPGGPCLSLNKGPPAKGRREGQRPRPPGAGPPQQGCTHSCPHSPGCDWDQQSPAASAVRTLGLRAWPPRASSPPSAPLSTSTSLRPQIQNLGFFPIHGVAIKITVPVATRGGNRLLVLRDFLTDQVPGPGASTYPVCP